MANKPYITIKVANAVLALYGVEMVRQTSYDWFCNKWEHTYALVKLGGTLPDYSWEVPKLLIPNHLISSKQRLEYALDNLDKINPS